MSSRTPASPSLSAFLSQAKAQLSSLLLAQTQEFNFDFLAGVPTHGKFKWETERCSPRPGRYARLGEGPEGAKLYLVTVELAEVGEFR